MKDQGKTSSIQMLAAGLLGFFGIIGLGSLVTMHHGGAAANTPAFSVTWHSPADAGAGSPAPLQAARLAPAVASAGMSSPIPLLPSEAARGDAAAVPMAGVAAESVAQPSGAPAVSPATLAVGASVDMSGSASSSASAVAAAPKLKDVPARKPLRAPKLDLAKKHGSVASTVHYGVSSRSELMGRAAGPVYNFSGGGAKQGAQVAADNTAASGALKQVDAAEQQIDSSDVPDAEKAKIHRDLEEVRATASQPAPASQP